MGRQQLFVTFIGVLVVLVLYQLPKVVVDNKSPTLTEDGNSEEPIHSIEISQVDQLLIDKLRLNLSESNSNVKNVTFADSLARLFLVYNEIDSASKYAELIATLDTDISGAEKAGDIYYLAFGIMSDQNRAALAEPIRRYYQKVLDASSDRNDLKARIAMTYVTAENPMDGILRLRQLVEDDSTSSDAHFNLGLLSIQSAQYDRAIDRFKTVLNLDSANLEASFYLGVSYFENGQVSLAKQNFEKVRNESGNQAMIEMVEDYLKR
ncbi:MAG: tetratricopeptide repeat protein [Bacteroidetes bacterium]|nr:tetratricopeptide repeat protein [Bacteroidota bacterium]